jgi:outer membrane immunogenic protein
MKRLLLAGTSAATIAVSSAAWAADMYAPPYAPSAPAYSWTGCYAGAHVGWGWGRSTLDDAGPVHEITPAGATLTSGFLLGHSTASVNQSGAIFGGQVGCDYQFGNNFVIGVSGSAAGADIDGTGIHIAHSAGSGVFSESIHARTDFLADVSGRLGVTWGQALLYGKGGVAWSHNSYDDELIGVPFNASDTVIGALAGAGVEWKFAPNWSAFVEYNHYFFGTKALNFTAADFNQYFETVNVKQDIDAVKVGINYRFNWGALATRY